MKKTINVTSGVAIAISMVVGSGFLGLPGMAIEKTDPLTAIFGWLFVIFSLIPLIHIFTKLGVKYTSAAGLSKYAEEALGKWAGYGSQMVLCGAFAVGMPAFAMVGGMYFAKLCGLNEFDTGFFWAILFIVTSTILNMAGIKAASWVNKISIAALISIIIFIIFFNFNAILFASPHLLSMLTTHQVDYAKIWPVGAMLFWAFQGWENLSFGLEEFKNPEKNIPKVYWISFFAVIILYFSLAWTASTISIIGKPVVGVSALADVVGDGKIKSIFLFLMVLVLLANANSWIFGVSRMFYSASVSGLLPSYFSAINDKGVPRNSLILLCAYYIISIIFIKKFNISIATLFLLTTQNFLFLYGLTILAYLSIYRNKAAYIVGFFAIISWAALFFGFSWWIAYPIILFFIGGIFYKKKSWLTSTLA